MEHMIMLRRLGGAMLALGGVGFFLTGALHPQGPSGTFPEAMASMFASPTWQVAHWLAVTSTLMLLWALWLMLDGQWTHESLIGQAGARLVLLAGLFMAVQFAVELAAAPEAAAYATGAAVPMGTLVERMQAVGWPAFMLGFAILIVGLPSSAPAAVRVAGVVGATAMGLGGFLTEGLHLIAAGPLFIGGSLLPVWLVWSGIAAARYSQPSASVARRVERSEPAPTA